VLARVECADAGVVVAIQDWGAGIGSEDLPHIFQRFYRADRVRGDGGHGLGLALAQSIARTHGARIEVESQPGAGSTFRVRFARLGATLQPEPESQNAAQASGPA
jgi:signal transduction histidine kinase